MRINIPKLRITRKVIVETDTSKEFLLSQEKQDTIASISHPNKRVLAERIIAGENEEDLIKEYGRTRVFEMQKYIEVFSANKDANYQSKLKRGGGGVCIACQK